MKVFSAGTGHSYFGDVDYTLTYSTSSISPHDFSPHVLRAFILIDERGVNDF